MATMNPGTRPLVSVIIPVYNGERYIAETIASVVAQTEPSWEIIAVNDGSKDGSLGILVAEAVKDPRVRIMSVKNGGVSRARNTGVKAARGEYIAFLDQDDLWAPTKLELQLARFQADSGLGISYTNQSIINHDSAVVREKVLSFTPEKNRGHVFDQLVFNCFIGISSVMMKKELFDEIGGFDPLYSLAEDYDLLLKAVRNVPVDYIDDPLLLYREHCGSGTHTKIDRIINESFQILNRWREKDREFFQKHRYEYFIFWLKFMVLKIKVKIRRK